MTYHFVHTSLNRDGTPAVGKVRDIYGSNADALAQTNRLISLTTDINGTWTYSSEDYDVIFARRAEDGTVIPVESPEPTQPGVGVYALAYVNGKSPVRKDDLFVNVKDYGATGNGTTDDTAAIRTAINSLPNGGCVYFPSGTYIISSTLQVVGATRLVGAGMRNTTLKLAAGANCTMITTPDDGIQRYGLEIADLGFNGQAQYQSLIKDLIFIQSMAEPSFRNLYIVNPIGAAIHLGQSTMGMYCTVPLLDRIVIRGDGTYSQSHGIFLDSGSSDAVISNCDIGFFGAGAGISFSGHNGATILNTNTWQCRYGFQFYQSNRMRLTGCLSDYAKFHGYIAQQSSDLQLEGCQAREYGVAANSTYDGFRFEGVPGTPAQNILLGNCRAMSSRGRVGVSLQNDLSYVRVVGGSMVGQNIATSVVGSGVADYRFLAVAGVTDAAG